MSKELSADFWEERYRQTDTPWDIGNISPPLRHFIDKLTDKDLRILIPGAGKAHEAIYLHQQGFRQVYVCDWAKSSFAFLQQKVPNFPETHLLVANFFDLKLCVDLIIEQTFFCALPPSQRPDYVRQMASLLASDGKLAGLLFAEPFDRPGPPFGGTQEEYQTLFSPHFHIEQMAIAQDSIKPRLGRELFFILRKKVQ